MELEILEILSQDARTPAERIATMTGRSLAEVEAVIKSLEAQKILLKYPAMINWDKVERELVEAMIEVKVTPQRDEGFDVIAEKIYRYEEVSSVYLMSGGYDLLVTVRGRSMKQTALFVSEKLSTIENVLSTATHFKLKTYKDNGVIYEERRTDDRLAVTP
ncbi:MAG: Lrp/AsnC family transcriptional regulator [Eubacteriales bacterium]|nr:Lrp/AsnC family transcriptional regulator [Eubacteriales bacterium]